MKSNIMEFQKRYYKIQNSVLITVVFLFLFNVTHSQTADSTITTLFQNSYKVIDAMRLPGGFYLDALALGGAGAKPAALNANGVGLVSLCIADAMYKKTGDSENWDANAESKALQSINEWIRLKNTEGATNVNGLFHRYFKPADGSWVWVTEFSTIDNAILAAGFLFCRNYFHNNDEIVTKTTTLLNSMDLTAAVSDAGDKIFMILDDNGNATVLANPFNEYLILAWFAKNSNPSFPGYASAQTYWNNKYSNANNLPRYNYPEGNPTLSESGSFAQPSFHVQFCYYYSHYFGINDDYMTYFTNMATADKSWWLNNTSQQVGWGCGAGEIPGGGYSADAVNRNSQKIVSPPIMAGFSPVNPDVRTDLIALYDEGKGNGVYQIPGTSRDFIWRYKLDQPNQKTSYVQAIDFSTMLYGLAALPEYLGPEFFTKYNDFDFDSITAVNEIKENSNQLKNFPNPFRVQTNIAFEISVKSKVVLEIYSLNGQKIKQLVNNEMSAGRHSIPWNACNDKNALVEPGLYICRMSVGNQKEFSRQMLVVK